MEFWMESLVGQLVGPPQNITTWTSDRLHTRNKLGIPLGFSLGLTLGTSLSTSSLGILLSTLGNTLGTTLGAILGASLGIYFATPPDLSLIHI